MGINDRKQRHKEELKDIILKAAKELFLEKGYEATSMRSIAEKIEYSPATIYLHYKDKAEIFYALHLEGFKLLVNYFKVLASVADPFERLKAMGHVYINFANENPDFYNLMFVMSEPMEVFELDHAKEWNEGEDAFRFLHNTVIECMDKGYFKGMDAMGFSFMLWSTMHGLCTLRTSGHLDQVRQVKTQLPDINAVTAFTLQTFISMMERLK
ncbi:MAG: TetR/AcrR family transcriptional regulator [Cyclobacteriaceae bacterium]|nr:TetR/AcrR family transcriptional regulator [Cyclobacteriaceae bacterium]